MLLYDLWIWLISWHNLFFICAVMDSNPALQHDEPVNPTIVPLYHASDCRDSFMYTNLKFLSKRAEPLARGRIRPGQRQYILITGRDTALWLLQWLSLRQRIDAEPEPQAGSNVRLFHYQGWQWLQTWWCKDEPPLTLPTPGHLGRMTRSRTPVNSSTQVQVASLCCLTVGFCIDLFDLAQLWS